MLQLEFYQLKIILTAFILLSISSCSTDDDLGRLNDTIFVRHKDADMPAYIHGNGSEKVFLITLHEGPGGLGLSFRGTAFNTIENTCAVVYFDQRGSGMSQGSFSKNEVDINLMAQDVLALVKVIQKKYGNDSRFFLLGHGWGSTLGIATLLQNQHEFLGWIQVDGTHNPKDLYQEYITNFQRVAFEQIQLGNSTSFWESVNELIADVSPTFNRTDINRLNNRAFAAERILNEDKLINRPSGGRDDLAFNYNLITAFWNTSNIQSIVDPGIQGILSYTDRLSEIKTPTLILWGKYDMVVPTVITQGTYDNLGATSKKLVIFEKSGHSPIGSESDLFAEEVILFMDQNK